MEQKPITISARSAASDFGIIASARLLSATSRIAVLLFAALIALSGCNVEDELELAQASCEPIPEDRQDYDMLVRIQEMGLCASTAIEHGDSYFVEGDIGISKQQLVQEQQYAPFQQETPFFLVSVENAKNITVRVRHDFWISPQMRLARLEAARRAVAAWNSANILGLDFTLREYPDDRLGADITILSNDGSGPGQDMAVAATKPPQGDGKPFPFIWLNPNFDTQLPFQKQATIAHELGHSIGLLHTDSPAGHRICGSPASDPFSIMNTLPNTSLLSANDISAARALYPGIRWGRESIHAEYLGCSTRGTAMYTLIWGPSPGVTQWEMQRKNPVFIGNEFFRYFRPTFRVGRSSTATVRTYFAARGHHSLRLCARRSTGWYAAGSVSFNAPSCFRNPIEPFDNQSELKEPSDEVLDQILMAPNGTVE